MEKGKNYMLPQLVLTIFGIFMLGLSVLGFLSDDATSQAPTPVNPNINLQVKPAGGTPKSVINQLQGAGGLQRQAAEQGIQRPIGEQLQPNAKTSDPNSQNTVQ